jgi:hypothetical protein
VQYGATETCDGKENRESLTLDGVGDFSQCFCVCLVHLVDKALVFLPAQLLTAVEVKRRHI